MKGNPQICPPCQKILRDGNSTAEIATLRYHQSPTGIIQSLLTTCQLQDIEPYTYLVDVLQCINRHPAQCVIELTPRVWNTQFADQSGYKICIEIKLVACKPTTKHLISHWPSFIGALNSTRSYLNTTRRVYFYVIVKMWFKLPIYSKFRREARRCRT